MAYGPSQCQMAATPQQGDLTGAPQQVAAPIIYQQPQDLMPSAFTPPLPPQQSAPIIVTAPFMMGPSITMPSPEAQSAKPVAKTGNNQK